jgi:pyruvate dehydrogenase E2 component (dihydrolipoamide acetyltransferase)
MPVALLMPALSPTMTEGNIAKWIKKVGDEVVSGDIIAEVETDKATMEVEAIDEGKLASIIYPDGSENVQVNKLIGVIALEGDTEKDIKDFINKNTDIIKENANEIDVEVNEVKSNNNEDKDSNANFLAEKKDLNDNEYKNPSSTNNINLDQKRIKISPLAKRIAELQEIDITKVIGSGPNGRIIKRDLEDYNNLITTDEKKPTFNEEDNKRVIKLSNIRKTIALRLQEAKSTIPHFYLKGKVQLDTLLKENNEDYKISFNDYFIKALALSLKKVPSMNANWNNDGSVTEFNYVDISVAVATDNGLFTPVVKHACNKSLENISKEVKAFVIKAKEGKLLPEDYTGGSFSISNLGMYGIEEFSAIINPPQAGIIAIGDILEDVNVINGEFKACKTMSYVLSVDHRIVDGAIASKLLKYFKFFINNPSAMLI